MTSAALEPSKPLDELGPVDYVVVEFPAGSEQLHRRDGGGAARAGRRRHDPRDRRADPRPRTRTAPSRRWSSPTSRSSDELQALEAELAELLAEDDVVHLAAAMDPGSTAGVLIWENLWAAPFASAARRSGGQLIANGRIPIQAIIASIEADEALATEGD